MALYPVLYPCIISIFLMTKKVTTARHKRTLGNKNNQRRNLGSNFSPLNCRQRLNKQISIKTPAE